MTPAVPASLRASVRRRAQGRCEYCLLHEDDAWESHQPDHVVAVKHRGQTVEDNLAWTCGHCNRFKGTDLASIDIATGKIVRLFNPRLDHWPRHFRLAGGRIVPRTAVGRVTESLLRLNRPDRLLLRLTLARKGLYPRW
jgi:hypothetical protein